MSMTEGMKALIKARFPCAVPYARIAREVYRTKGGGAYLAGATRRALGVQNPKVFCIGRNKTGTTSLKQVLADLGYRIGDQRRAELLMEDWGQRDFRRLIRYCHSADAFQDVPFSHAYTFQAMDAAFPGSKFILTIRDSADQWYESCVRFHTMRLEKITGERRPPTLDDIKSDPYIYPGYRWRVRMLTGTAANSAEVFPKEEMIAHYNWYNATVQDYFRHRPQDLLILNLAEADSMQRLYQFLDKPYDGAIMPRLNQSE